MTEEENGSAQPLTKIPTRIKKFIYSIIAIVVALTVLITKFDELVDTWSALWEKLFPPGTDYVVFVIDTSAHMQDDFQPGQSKWYSLVSAVQTALPLFDPENTAIRTFGGPCLEPGSTSLAVDFGGKSTQEVDAKIAAIQPSGDDAPLFKALAETVNDLRQEARFKKPDPSLTNRIMVISGGFVCDYNEMSFTQLEERLAELGIKLEFNVIGMNADAVALQQLSALSQKLKGSLYAVDNAAELAGAVRSEEPVDALTKGKQYYENEQDQRALPLLELYPDATEATVYRANIYANKNSPARDEEKAVSLYKKAAEEGSGEAFYQLGNIYSEKGLEDAARKFWESAVDRGFDLAKEKLKRVAAK